MTELARYDEIRELISSDEIQNQFRIFLGERAPQFLASILGSVATNEYLKQCDPNSVVMAATRAAALDLVTDPNIGYAYMIPYKGKATLQVGYKGFVQLAIRSGQYQAINAFEVYDGEKIVEDRLSGTIKIVGSKQSDEVIGYGAYFSLKNGFEKYDYMTIEEIHEHAKKYSQSYGNAASPWNTAFKQMAKKTVLKRLIGVYGPKSILMQSALSEELNGDEPDKRLISPEDVIEGSFEEPVLEPDNIDVTPAPEFVPEFEGDASINTPDWYIKIGIESNKTQNEHSGKVINRSESLPRDLDGRRNDHRLIIKAWWNNYRKHRDQGYSPDRSIQLADQAYDNWLING